MTKHIFGVCVALLYLFLKDVKTVPQNLTGTKYKDPAFLGIKGEKGWINMGQETVYYNYSKTETFKNKSVIIQPKVSITTMDDHVLGIKVAAVFRNNLIRVFGYVLHRPNMELNSELYTSLYFILSTIKLNQVNLISMVPYLKELIFKTPNEVFTKIFEQMETHLPSYLTCAAGFWKDAIAKKEVNMDNILKPDPKGPLKVNLFRNLNDELLSKVAKEEKTADPKDKEEKKVLYDFNTNLVQVMRYIKKHKNHIHQMFFSALVLFFPRNAIQPDLEESIEIVMEFLDQVEIKRWKKYVEQLDSSKTEDPYFIVKEILNKLILDNTTTVVIKESLQIILTNLVSRNPTAFNPHYNSMASLVDLNEVKVPYMLNYIGRGTYPTEIVMSAKRVQYHYTMGHIKHITLMTHFIAYVYSSPMEILIALLDRIIKRQPDLPNEIIDATGAVYSYLVFAHRYVGFPAVMPDDLQNLNIIFLGVRSPNLPTKFLQSVDSIINLLQSVKLDLVKILAEMPVYICPTPMICFMNFLARIKVITAVRSELLIIIIEILESDCFRGQCKIEIKPAKNDSLVSPDLQRKYYNDSEIPTTPAPTSEGSTAIELPTTTAPTTTTTVLSTLTQPTEGPITTFTTLKPTSATPPTTVTVEDIPQNVTEISPNKTKEAMITVIHEFKLDQTLASLFLKVMESADFKAKIEKMEKSRLKLLISHVIVTLEALNVEVKTADSHIKRMIKKFLFKLKHIEQLVKLITTEKQPNRPDIARLIVSVPAPMENETELFQQLSLLLQKDELFNLISKNLHKNVYKNIGTLLKAVLTEELKLEGKLSAKETEAIKYYVEKIQLHGFGQGKILWGVDVDVISQNIKISDIMDNAIDFKSLKNEQRKQFNSIIVYMRSNPAILHEWDKWIYYTKCGDFTKALFHLLISQAGTPASVKAAISALTPLISYDKNGQKPTFGTNA